MTLLKLYPPPPPPPPPPALVPQVGFTAMAKEVEPSAVMTLLNQLFTMFDKICEEQGVQKVGR